MMLFICTVRCSFLWWGREPLEPPALKKPLIYLTGNCLSTVAAAQAVGDTDLMKLLL